MGRGEKNYMSHPEHAREGFFFIVTLLLYCFSCEFSSADVTAVLQHLTVDNQFLLNTLIWKRK